MILVAFYQEHYQEYFLMNREKKAEIITLEKKVLGLQRDVDFRIDCAAGLWTMHSDRNRGIKFLYHGFESQLQTIEPEQTYHILTEAREQIDLLCYTDMGGLPVMEKYVLKTDTAVTIGSAEGNTFPFSCHTYVSRAHARLEFRQNGWFLTDSSANGTFVNGTRVRTPIRLHFGDVIFIFGLKLVYFGTILAVCNLFGTLLPCTGLAIYDTERNPFGLIGNGAAQPYFNRPPRNLPAVYAATVSIEAPPSLQSTKKKSLLSTIGPSLTMALPMMLGCGMMAFSMSSSGHSSFMGMGIVTALGSALMGAVWAIVNLRSQEQEELRKRDQRFYAYGNYLIGLSKDLAEKYHQNYQAMNEMYPAAAVCVRYGRDNSSLWNRNFSHADFLYERLGLGDIPFQVDIHAQKKEFMLVSDRMQGYAALIQQEYRTLHHVPVGIDLMKIRLIGVVGRKSRSAAAEMTQTLLCQIAETCCYTDVKIVLLNHDAGEAAQRAWGFLRWLPHCWSEDHTTRFFSMTAQEEEDISYELIKVLRRRAESTEKTAYVKPHYIIVVTDVAAMENNLLSAYLMNPKPSYGITTLLLSKSYTELPNSCNYAIELAGDKCFINDMMDISQEKTEILRDRVSEKELHEMARRLADVRVEEREINQDIPNSVAFLEMYGVSSIAALHIAQRWEMCKTCDTMRVPIGVRAGGQLCYLDIHEKFHGPHGLVAGTTGSGKSEMLQSYILSMCVNYGPEDVTFFLIDYKGGGMANLFHNLPHLVGQISNLSGNQIRRAMISIKSESLRRQRVFNEAGVNNINQYTQMYKNGECIIPIPHLMIIIDEFAELRKAEPEFMKELISVAQVGRSLGIHLILATQKPSGTVDDNIRSNSKFRLCLRVQDRQDSNDMLHRPDAAYITQTGGCILQVGNDEIFEQFQSAWSGANYNEDSTDQHSAATILTRTGKPVVTGNRMKLRRMEKKRVKWLAQIIHALRQLYGESVTALAAQPLNQCGDAVRAVMVQNGWHGSRRQKLNHLDTLVQLWQQHAAALTEDTAIAEAVLQAAGQDSKLPELEEQTQLDAIVDVLADIAASGVCQPAYQLWLPALLENISLTQLRGWEQQSYVHGAWERKQTEWTLETAVGMLDDPANQIQTPLHLDFARNGHCAVLGTVVSGKSTFLQTALYGLVNAYSPDCLNAYIVDFSSRLLGIFDGLPHVGGVVFENEREKLDKLFYLLMNILEERKKLLQGGSFQEYVQRHTEKLPAVVLVIDNYAGFKEKTDGKYEQQMMQFSREGIGYGFYLLLSASGFGMNEISSRMGENLRTIFCLEMTDKFKYAEALRMTGIDILPESGTHGRGLIRYDGRCLEYQTALMNEQTDEYSRGQQAVQLFEQMRRSWQGSTARHIPEIPEDPVYSQLEALQEYRQAEQTTGLLPLGYNQVTATLYSISLQNLYCYLLLGTPHAGKSNALQLLLSACAGKKEANIGLCAAADSSIAQAGRQCHAALITSDAELFAFLKQLTVTFVERNKKKQEYVRMGLTDAEIYQKMQAFPPVFLLIDDLTAFFQMVYKPSEGVGAMNKFVENMMEKGALHNIYVFGCANVTDHARLTAYKAYSSFTAEHKGMLLGTSIQAQRVLEFGKQSYAETMKALPKGLAALTETGENGASVRRVVLPLAGR